MISKQQYRIAACALLISLLLLTACHLFKHGNGNGRGRKSWMYGAYVQRQIGLLRNANVQVIPQGEKLRLIMPADDLFAVGSVQLKARALPVLREVVNLIESSHRVFVMVIGYTDHIGTKRDKQNLSTMQARNVAAYLWSQGVRSDHLRFMGKSDQFPISSYDYIPGYSLNRRVEIKLW